MLMISEQAKISKLADIEDSVRDTKIIIEKGVVIDSLDNCNKSCRRHGK